MKRLSRKQLGWLFALLSSLFFLSYIQPFISLSNPNDSVIFRFHKGNPETLALSQPDIAINYAFIYNRLIFQKTLYAEPLSQLAIDQLHPRSTTVVDGHITPIGFPGIIVVISAILTPWVIAFGDFSTTFFLSTITAAVAAVTPIFFFFVLSPFFRKRVALISSLLLYAMPLWWYYGSWPVNQHTWLIFFLIFGLFCGIQSSKRRAGEWRYLYSLFAGISMGLAIFIRPVAALWIIPALVAIIILRRKRLHWRYQYLPFIAGGTMMAIVFAVTQIIFYGSILGSGYVPPAVDGSAGKLIADNFWASTLLTGLLPYGFHPVHIATNAWHYLIRLIFPWMVLALVGALLIIRNRQSKRWRRSAYYLYIVAGVSLFLVIYYGSSRFFDSTLGTVPTIGTSYTRYFLPIYVFSLPFVARALVSLAKLIRARYRSAAIITVMCVLAIHGYYISHKQVEGIDMLSSNMTQFYEERAAVLANTWPGGAIVTHGADKYLFPYRRTIVSFEDAPVIALQSVEALAAQDIPLYWYYHVPHDEFLESWKERLKTANLGLSEPIYSGYNMQLRAIEKSDEIQ